MSVQLLPNCCKLLDGAGGLRLNMFCSSPCTESLLRAVCPAVLMVHLSHMKSCPCDFLPQPSQAFKCTLCTIFISLLFCGWSKSSHLNETVGTCEHSRDCAVRDTDCHKCPVNFTGIKGMLHPGTEVLRTVMSGNPDGAKVELESAAS